MVPEKKWEGAQNNSHGRLGASESGAESQGCCRHEHSDLEEKSTSALTMGQHSKLLRKHDGPHSPDPKAAHQPLSLQLDKTNSQVVQHEQLPVSHPAASSPESHAQG